MKEKIRVLKDGNRIAVLIEDASPELMKKVQQILCVSVMDSVVGLDEPVPANVNVVPDSPSTQEDQKPKETVPDNTKSEVDFVFPKGPHQGKTVVQLIQSGDIDYLHFIMVGTKYRYQTEVYRDFFRYGDIIAKSLEEKYADTPRTVLKYLCDICAHIPFQSNKPNPSAEILESLGWENVDALLNANNSQDIEYVFSALISYIEKVRK